MTLEDLIDEMHTTRERIRDIKRTLDPLEERMKELEEQVMHAMNEAGLKKAGSTRANVSLSTEEVPTVMDPDANWPEIFHYLVENDYLEILQKRLNAAAWRELKAQGIEIPHIQPYERVKLSLRAA